MADITMCANTLCPLAGTCYRMQATPNDHWQSMAMFEYDLQDNGIKCDNYWPVNQTTKEQTK